MSVLAKFLLNAPEGTESTLAALACAESLTDELAFGIYHRAPVAGLSAEYFISASSIVALLNLEIVSGILFNQYAKRLLIIVI